MPRQVNSQQTKRFRVIGKGGWFGRLEKTKKRPHSRIFLGMDFLKAQFTFWVGGRAGCLFICGCFLK